MKTPTLGEVDSGFTESPDEQPQECYMFTIENNPKPPTVESILRAEFMETIEQLKNGQHFDVPYDYEGLGKTKVVNCINNYVSQFRKTVPEGAAIHYKMKNCKEEKGGYSRITMYQYPE